MTEQPITLGAVLLWAVPILLTALGVVAGLLLRQTIGRIRGELSDHEGRLRDVEGTAGGAMPRVDCTESHDRLLDQIRRESGGAERVHDDVRATLELAREAVALAGREPRA